MVSCRRMVNTKCSKGGKEVRDEGMKIIYFISLYSLDIGVNELLILA